MEVECTYLCKLTSKAIGLIFYIVFQVVQFGIIFITSTVLARFLTLLVAHGDLVISAPYELFVLFGLILFIRQHFLISRLDGKVTRGLAKCFGIAVADIRFWEGVFESQVIIMSQVILGPILRDIHLNPQMSFDDGPIPTDLSTRSRELMFYYILFVAIIISISSGRTGCSGLCRAAGDETGFCCRRPANSLGYTSYSLKSIAMFLVLLLPNIALAAAYALLLNGFYSVGCVIGLEAVLIYYWLIFISVLIGFAAAAVEHRKPFPQPNIKPPYFAFVNNLKAQAYLLHYCILPSLVWPAMNAKRESVLYSQNDNFRLFAILASLNLILQIKLIAHLLRLALEIQKTRARQVGPPPQQNQNQQPRAQGIGGQDSQMRRVRIQRLPPLPIAHSPSPSLSEENIQLSDQPTQHPHIHQQEKSLKYLVMAETTRYEDFVVVSAVTTTEESVISPEIHSSCSAPSTSRVSNGNEEVEGGTKTDSAPELSNVEQDVLNNNVVNNV